MIHNTLTALRNTTSLVAEATVNSNTIEMRAEGNQYSKHYLIINGEWDHTYRRNRQAAQAEYDATVEDWNL